MRILTYISIFVVAALLLALSTPAGSDVWTFWIMQPLTAALCTLLVWLVARLLGTGGTPLEITITALFMLLFNPNAYLFFERDETSILELCSQCIVPFFLSQYNRIQRKDFHRSYTLMLLMGIFCSFTHDGITLPLCLAFGLMAWQRRNVFFRLACWPMVIGWLFGTILLLVTRNRLPDLLPRTKEMADNTTAALVLLWDTKVFLIAVGLTFWFTTTKWGRRELRRIYLRQRLIVYCTLFALCIMPFAPLGISNAVTSVSFFGMLLAMLLFQGVERNVYAARAQQNSQDSAKGHNTRLLSKPQA